MENVITDLLCQDSVKIKQATAQLQELLKEPDVWNTLCDLFSHHPNPLVRQYAATIIRKNLAKYEKFKSLPLEHQKSIKQVSIPALLNEPEKAVRNTICHFIGVLLCHEEQDNGSWINEVLQMLFSSISQPDPQCSEKASSIFVSLTDTAVEVFLSHMDTVCQMFEAALATATASCNISSPTMLNILQGMSYFVPLSVGNTAAEQTYTRTLPGILSVIKAFAQPGRTAAEFNTAFDLLDSILDSIPKVLKPKLREIVEFCLEVCNNANVDLVIRIRCANFLSTLSQYHKTMLCRLKLIEPILTNLYRMMIESPVDLSVDDYFEDETCNSQISVAAQTIDSIALYIPAERFLPHLIKILEPAFQSQDFIIKRCAFIMMAVVAEGCAKIMRGKYLKPMLDVIIVGINDKHLFVRNAAFFALAQFADHLQPEISVYASEILPILLEILQKVCQDPITHSADGKHLERLFFAFESIIENLDQDQIKPFMPILMQSFFGALSPDIPAKLRNATLGVIGSIVVASKENFLPYMAMVVELIRPYLIKSSDDEDIRNLRITSLDTLALLALHIGRQNFLPLAQDTVKFTVDLLKGADDAEEKRAIYDVFGALAKIYKNEMGSVFPEIMTFMYETLLDKQNGRTGEQLLSEPEEVDEEADPNTEIDIEVSDDEIDEDDLEDNQTSSAMEEKASALQAIMSFAKNSGETFADYSEASFQYVYQVLDYPSDVVRKSATEASVFVLALRHKTMSANEFAHINNKLFWRLETLLRDEPDHEIAVILVESFNTLLNELGRNAFTKDNMIGRLLSIAHDGLHHKLKCQGPAGMNADDEEYELIDSNDGDDENEGESEMAEVLLEECGNLIPSLGKALTPDEFSVHFDSILPVLLKKISKEPRNSRRDDDDDEEDDTSFINYLIFGILAECFQPLGKHTGKYFELLLPYYLVNITDPVGRVRQNAFYGFGQMIKFSGSVSYGDFSIIINHLSTAVATETNNGAMDNLIGCLCNCIIINRKLVPLPEVLPVLFQHLPLKDDFTVNDVLFDVFHLLYKNHSDILLLYFEQLVLLAIHVLHKKQYGEDDDDTKNSILSFLKQLRNNHPIEFNNLCSTKVTTEQNAFLQSL